MTRYTNIQKLVALTQP